MKRQGFTATGMILVIVLALIAVFGAYYLGKQDSTNTASQQPTTVSTESQLPNDLSSVQTASQIRQQAAGDLDGATITNIELENEDIGLVYKLRLSDGRTLFYNAITGERVDDPSDDSTTSNSEPLPTNLNTNLSVEAARKIAMAEHPDKTIRKVELESENGVLVYSFRFTDDSRLDVSAENGNIVRNRDDGSSGSSSDD